MFDFKFKISLLGIVIFLLPMFINMVYAIFPPVNAVENEVKPNQFLEMVEQATRILYAIAICVMVSNKKVDYKSIWLYLGILFLVLYHIVWIRYFIGGRDVALLGKSFLFIPLPLAVFPVLYFICGAVWLHNYIAVIIMVIFGIAHNIISYHSFCA